MREMSEMTGLPLRGGGLGRKTETCCHSRPPRAGTTACHPSLSCPTTFAHMSISTQWDNLLFLAHTESEVPKFPVDRHQYCTKYVCVQGGSPQLGCCGKGHKLL